MTDDDFIDFVLRNGFNKSILERIPALGLQDCWLVSGAVFQTVWDILSDLPPEHGIKDYDIFYFDPDTTWESEDAAIRRAKAAFADLDVEIEVRNQARVHLWFPEKFGIPYPPLSRATEGIDRFLQINAQVGIRPSGEGFDIYAPRGLGDIEAMRVRPNLKPNFQAKEYDRKAQRWKTMWPRVVIEPA